MAGELTTVTRTLSYSRAEQVQPLLTATVLSQRGSHHHRRAHEHAHHHGSGRSPEARDRAPGQAGPAGAAGRDRGAIVQTTRNFARQLGVQWGFRAARCRSWKHTAARISESATIGGSTGAIPGGPMPSTWVSAGELCRRAGSRRNQRRAESRHGHLSPRVAGQPPGPIHTTSRDAKQHCRRDHPGCGDSDSDGREQHGDGDLRDAALSLRVTPQITSHRRSSWTSSLRIRRQTSGVSSMAILRSTHSGQQRRCSYPTERRP